MRYKVVDNHFHALEFVPDCNKSLKMCHGGAETYLFAI